MQKTLIWLNVAFGVLNVLVAMFDFNWLSVVCLAAASLNFVIARYISQQHW